MILITIRSCWEFWPGGGWAQGPVGGRPAWRWVCPWAVGDPGRQHTRPRVHDSTRPSQLTAALGLNIRGVSVSSAHGVNGEKAASRTEDGELYSPCTGRTHRRDRAASCAPCWRASGPRGAAAAGASTTQKTGVTGPISLAPFCR